MSTDEIPQLPTWKMFNDTITSITAECSEDSLKRLAKIIKNMLNFFVPENTTITPSNYENITNKYKIFNTWVLGHLFYISINDKKPNTNIVIDMQLWILEKLAKTQLHICVDISNEYFNILNQTIAFKKRKGSVLVLTLFEIDPKNELNQLLNLSTKTIEINQENCDNVILKTIKCIKFFLLCNIGGTNNYCRITIFDHLLFLLCESSTEVKFEIFALYLELMKQVKSSEKCIDDHLIPKLEQINLNLEQLVNEIYKQKMNLNTSELMIFENLVIDLINQLDHRKLNWINNLINNNINNIENYELLSILFQHIDHLPNYYSINFEKWINNVICTNRVSTFILFKNIIIKDINNYLEFQLDTKDIEVFRNVVSETWSNCFNVLKKWANNANCTDLFKFLNILSELFMQIKCDLSGRNDKRLLNLIYFDERFLFTILLSKFNQNTDGSNFFQFLSHSAFLFGNKNLVLIFEILKYVLVEPQTISLNSIDIRWKKQFITFLETLNRCNYSLEMIFLYMNYFIAVLTSSLFEVDSNLLQLVENDYFKVCKKIMEGPDISLQCLVIRNLPLVTSLFDGSQSLSILLHVISSKNFTISQETLQILPKILCMSSANYVKYVSFNENKIVLQFDCALDNTLKNLKIYPKCNLNTTSLRSIATKVILEALTSDNKVLKIKALECLPYCCRHISQFNTSKYVQLWMQNCGDKNEEVREKFREIIAPAIKYSQNDETLSKEEKNEILNILLEYLLRLSKQALKIDYEMQFHLLQIIEKFISIKSKIVTLGLSKILIYFIMMPTSKHCWIAINKFIKLAKENKMTPNQLYKQHNEEMCEIIAHLCAVINWSLPVTLQKIAATLAYNNSKEFICRECRHLLPFFVSRIKKLPTVKKLIEEVAVIVDIELSELLANNYGNIFLRIFLYDTKEDFKFCMEYMEETTHLVGPVLRKRNMRIILNELLINLHHKRDKVLLALKLLAREDTEYNEETVTDYLRAKLLGILYHFDISLAVKTRTDLILSSLADLMKFMGPTHIGPLRFKIIAMLRTANYQEFSDLGCNAWDAFIHSCEVDILGPHLATIFVSLLPLMKSSSEKVNNIFRYLVIENEQAVKDYIKDLFYLIDDKRIEKQVNLIIKKYASTFNNLTLKETVSVFLNYLQHETMEVRIFGLKYLKNVIAKNRLELDKMILGYNGIDSIIVELVKTLMQGAREKNIELKLACGDVIGELGAIEPSHLPRVYVQSRSFTFFISDDDFIKNTLNELIRSLQRERNTYDIDRYSLAIQEYLKIYEISPDCSSKGNHIWKQLSESQQELIYPLLTSKYIMKPTIDSSYPCPIYGSNLSTSFQSWLYNWTVSMILTLPQNLQSNLNICLPAMKQDYRILMSFLPHILLHGLIEGKEEAEEKIFTEMNLIITTFINKTSSTDNDKIIVATNSSVIEGSDDLVPAQQCMKTIFVILDFLEIWMREWQWQKCSIEKHKPTYRKLRDFLARYCKLQLAKCNYHCSEYARALLYLEEYMMSNPQEIDNHLSLLAEIYAQLNESDGVSGVMALRRTQLSIEERIRALEVSGKFTEAICCYQRLTHPLKLCHFRGLVQCNLYLDNVHSALHIVEGAIDEHLDYGTDIFELQSEIFWRLGRFEDANNLINETETTTNSCWGVQIGRVLLNFKNQNRDQFKQILDNAKRQQIEYLGTASLEEGSYLHGYCYIARLHALNELEQIEKATYDILNCESIETIRNIITNLTQEWETRIKVVQESVKIIEPLLCLRRIALDEARKIVESKIPSAAQCFNSQIGFSWLKSAKIARDAGSPQAYSYIIKAEEFDLKELFLEKAKLHWSKAEHEDALKTLYRGLEEVLPSKDLINTLSLEQKKICAEAKLLIATYNDSLSMVNTEINISNYKESIEIYKEWETNLVSLGQFYDKIFQNMSSEGKDSSRGSDMQIHIINYFGKSLQYGTSYVYQSMPRMLSIWFDYGTRLLDIQQSAAKNEGKGNLLRMTKLIDSFLERLPTYIFLTAFSQLVSRICHPQKEVYSQLKSIIIKLILEYPQHSLWMIISVVKSSYATRAKRCNEILSDSRIRHSPVLKVVKDFTDLAEKLIELCNKSIAPDVNTTTVSALVRALPRLLSTPNFSEIMIPTNKFRKLVLPNPDFSSTQHNPFPNQYVYIAGIEEEVVILHSLQRPRKITFKGSDGKKYVQMLKPKDDLRKDFRLMEFNDIVNQLLSREPEARQKRLNIRLYSVSPLNEECGLIEWIPDLVGLRPILMTLYKQIGKGMKARELRDASCNIKDPLSQKRDVFLNKLLPNHPPMLGEWFRKTFPDAQSWVTARTAYIRTTAVMSMAGYILGLGDRHGENILLDSVCGDAVHVDFNCLFNKGETFEWPERVPFRLTQNMVSAMGPLGVEGIFRNSCVCTLKVLRRNTNTLMSIVTPFVYDPLVSWPRAKGSNDLGSTERTNEQALDHIKNIELRLNGIVKTKSRTLSIPLSVDGQTNHLINEAMSIDNLCQMYIGWGPYL